MSTTQMTTGNPLAVKAYSRKTWLQALRRTALSVMYNSGSVYVPPELQGAKNRGDQLTFSYVGKLTKVPIGEGGTASVNAEALETKAHSMAIGMSRLPVESPNEDTIEQQRTYINFDEVARQQLAARAAELIDASTFNQLAGAAVTSGSLSVDGTNYTSAADRLHIYGHNTPVAPTSARIVRASAAANDESLTSADTMRLDYLDYCGELLSATGQPVEPLDDGCFNAFISPYDIVNMRHDTSGKVQWFAIELAALMGGDKTDLETKFPTSIKPVGKYRNFWIYEAPRVAQGVNSSTGANITTVRRNVIVGKNALSYASPNGGLPKDKDVPMTLHEELRDVGYYKLNEARMIYGLKKMQPTGKEDIGVVVLSTYAAAHA